MQIKVWNKNAHEYSEKFRGKTVIIPAKSFVEMDEDEAVYFKGTFTFPQRDEQNRPDPRHFKMIHLEYPEDYKLSIDPLLCHANGQKATSTDELAKMLSSFADRVADDKEAEKLARRQDKVLKKENDELKLQVTDLAEKINKLTSMFEKLGVTE